jgi:transposase
MREPLFVRPFTAVEHQALEAGLRAAEAFTVRRCQILLKRAQRRTPQEIHAQLGWSDQCVREAIHAFNERGLACLQPQSKRPKSATKMLPAAALSQRKDWLHQSPREFGLPTSRWTLDGLATVSAARGLTPQLVSRETIRAAIRRLGVSWQRAKRWIDSPDPAYARKKGPEIG